MEHMRSTRAAALCASFLLPLSLLAACSGDDEPESSSSPESGPSDDGSAGGQAEDKQKIRTCRVDVALTGAESRTVSGKGRAIAGNSSGPRSLYQFEKDGLRVDAYSEGEDFTPSVNVSVGGANYSTDPDADGLEIAPNGRSAVADVSASGVEAEAPDVQVVAEFACK